MVAQNSLQGKASLRRPWFNIVLPFTIISLVALLCFPDQAIPIPSPVVNRLNLDNPKREMDMIDQTQKLVDEQSWGTGFSLPLSNEKPSLQHEMDSPLSLSWIRSHLSTKSPYPHDNKRVGPMGDIPEGYELVQLHLICRHGTRYPSSSKAITFQKLTEKLRQVAVPGFEWLERWPSERLYPISKGNLLSTKGDSDLYRIGRRFGIRYQDFLDRYPYDANTYELQSSSMSRSSQSAYAFSVGFLEGRRASDINVEPEIPPIQPVNIFTLPIGLDKELAVKYACPRWLENVKGSPKVVREQLLYKERFLPEIAERLSIMFSTKDGSSQVNITTKDVETIFGICGFEVAFHDNDQTWCQLLRQSAHETEKSNFLKLEMSDDLNNYYSFGPGVPFNKHLGCGLGTSLSNAIEGALTLEPEHLSSNGKSGDDDDDDPRHFRGLFKFGHAETILFLSSFLGLYDQKGIPLRGDMTPEQYAQREFRASEISPFAANIAFEVFRPKPRNLHHKKRIEYEEKEQYFEFGYHVPEGLVRLLINEEPMIIPGCGSDYFCEWATLKKIFRRAGAGCNFDGCCTSLGSTKVSSRVFVSDRQDEICLSVEPLSRYN
ncbi:PHOsphatase [Mortierella sp. AD010]|nr:PHOsphatase [Mortierella sp. AD010]